MELNHISDFEGVYRNLHVPAVIIGGVFVLIALVLSTLLILQHLRSYNNPAEQKWVIGVLFMVPVYAAESGISWRKVIFSGQLELGLASIFILAMSLADIPIMEFFRDFLFSQKG